MASLQLVVARHGERDLAQSRPQQDGDTRDTLMWLSARQLHVGGSLLTRAACASAGPSKTKHMEHLQPAFGLIANGAPMPLLPCSPLPRMPFPPGSQAALRAGTPLTRQGHKGILIGLLGDLEYLHKYLKLYHHGANAPCCWCKCSRVADAALPWTVKDHSFLQHLWRGDEAEWAPNKIALFGQLGLNAHNVWPDWMHTCHLGTIQYAIGSTLQLMLSRLPGTKAARLERVFSMIKEQYQDAGTHAWHMVHVTWACGARHMSASYVPLTQRR